MENFESSIPDILEVDTIELNDELEAFDSVMISYAKYLVSKGLLKAPHYFNLLLGNIACAQADLLNAGIMVRDLPENSFWNYAGIGNAQLMMTHHMAVTV